MPEGLTPAVDRAIKDVHLACERLWATVPAIYRRGPSGHLFFTPDGSLGEFHPGMSAVVVLCPSGEVGEFVVHSLISLAAEMSERYYGTRGVDHREIPW